jgi:hypothetical protein
LNLFILGSFKTQVYDSNISIEDTLNFERLCLVETHCSSPGDINIPANTLTLKLITFKDNVVTREAQIA